VLYFPTFKSISDAWIDNGAYSHGYLVYFLSLYIAWNDRNKLTLPIRTSWLVFPIILGLGLVAWIASLATVQSVSQLAVYGMTISIFVVFFGYQFLRIMFTPIFINFLVLPVWNFLQSPLQDWSGDSTYIVLKQLGIPTLKVGHHFTVPGGRFVVEEACSGLGFFLCATMLGVFYAHMNQLTKSKAFLLVIVAAVISVIANWIRIIIIMLVGNYTKMDHFIVDDHLTFGWIVFSFALVPFFMISSHFFPARSTSALPDSESVHSYKMPVKRPVLGLRLIISFMALVAVPLLSPILVQDLNPQNFKAAWTLSEEEARKLRLRKTGAKQWVVQYPEFDQFSQNAYLSEYDGASVIVYTGTYLTQSQGTELINVNNRLYDRKWESVVDEKLIKHVKATKINARVAYIKSRGGESKTVYSWYVTGKIATSDPRVAKILEVYGKLAGQPSSLVVLIADGLFYSDEINNFVKQVQAFSLEMHSVKR